MRSSLLLARVKQTLSRRQSCSNSPTCKQAVCPLLLLVELGRPHLATRIGPHE
jgi:hypothetical protein